MFDGMEFYGSVGLNKKQNKMRNQTLLNKIEQQFFAKAKAEFEKQKTNLAECDLLGIYHRPEMTRGAGFVAPEKLLYDYNITVVDQVFLNSIQNEFGKSGLHAQERHYCIYQSKEETTNDIGRMTGDQIWVSQLNDVFATCLDLIEGEKKYGPLYEQLSDKDRNIDAGYCLLTDEEGNKGLYVVWVERVKKKEGEKSQFHIHCELVPRYYKPLRRYLVDGTEPKAE